MEQVRRFEVSRLRELPSTEGSDKSVLMDIASLELILNRYILPIEGV